MSKDEARLNSLRRSTNFTCNLRFRCDFPEPPSDPKLLIAPLQPEKLASFSITSLERNPRRELVLEPDLGIHIGLMDTSEYSVTDETAQLAAEDQALLEGASEFDPNPKAHKKVRERLRGSKAELSWLMRTSYIANDTENKRQAVQVRAREVDNADNSIDADEAHLREVEVSFEAARREPMHPTDPTLKAVEITPVLPALDRRRDENYVLIDFEGDPTADHQRLSKLPPPQRQQLAGEAVAKSYALPGGKPFLAYMVPKATPSDAEENDQSREAREGEYEWVREYQYDVSNKQDAGGGTSTYLLHLEDGRATYVDLNTRMRCTKRTRGSQGADLRTEFPRPSKITVLRTEKEAASSADD